MLVVGLGNPGAQYARTKHNIGFWIVDALADSAVWKSKFRGEFTTVTVAGQSVALLKPQTFMNVSGASVHEALQFYKWPAAELLVVHDELDLPLGEIKLMWNRGAGGHNGIASVIENLGTKEFWRLRCGIGRPTSSDAGAQDLALPGRAANPKDLQSPSDFVLSPFAKSDQPRAQTLCAQAVEAIRLFVDQGPQPVQQWLAAQAAATTPATDDGRG